MRAHASSDTVSVVTVARAAVVTLDAVNNLAVSDRMVLVRTGPAPRSSAGLGFAKNRRTQVAAIYFGEGFCRLAKPQYT